MAWKPKKRILIFLSYIRGALYKFYRKTKKKIVRFLRLCWEGIKFIQRGFKKAPVYEVVVISEPAHEGGELMRQDSPFDFQGGTPREVTPRSGTFKRSSEQILNNIDELVKIKIASSVPVRAVNTKKIPAVTVTEAVEVIQNRKIEEKSNKLDSKELS